MNIQRMASKYIKRHATSLTIKIMTHNKLLLYIHYDGYDKKDDNQRWQGCGEMRTLAHAAGMMQPL